MAAGVGGCGGGQAVEGAPWWRGGAASSGLRGGFSSQICGRAARAWVVEAGVGSYRDEGRLSASRLLFASPSRVTAISSITSASTSCSKMRCPLPKGLVTGRTFFKGSSH